MVKRVVVERVLVLGKAVVMVLSMTLQLKVVATIRFIV
jgi:hypothetical protein